MNNKLCSTELKRIATSCHFVIFRRVMVFSLHGADFGRNRFHSIVVCIEHSTNRCAVWVVDLRRMRTRLHMHFLLYAHEIVYQVGTLSTECRPTRPIIPSSIGRNVQCAKRLETLPTCQIADHAAYLYLVLLAYCDPQQNAVGDSAYSTKPRISYWCIAHRWLSRHLRRQVGKSAVPEELGYGRPRTEVGGLDRRSLSLSISRFISKITDTGNPNGCIHVVRHEKC